MNTPQTQQTQQRSQPYPYHTWLIVAAALIGASWHASGQASTVIHEQSTPVVQATVLSAVPIFERVREPVAHEVCSEPRQARSSRTPAIVGGILGGLVGNQFGSGSGRTATTIAGAALGASIGADRSRRDSQRYSPPRHCEIKTEHREVERTVGYRVTYELDGHRYVTRTTHKPGETITIELEAGHR